MPDIFLSAPVPRKFSFNIFRAVLRSRSSILFASALGQSTTLSSSEPSCANSNLLLTPTLRGQILDYINDARNTLKNGQLLLENGEYALLPESMPELSWSCEVEEEMHDIAWEVCKSGMFIFENYTWFTNVVDMSHNELVYGGLHHFDIAGHYANYLSQHTIYAGTSASAYISTLHDKAETVGCAIYDCFYNANAQASSDDVLLPGAPSLSYTLSYLYCKITPDVQFGEKIYEVAANVNANFPSQDVICPEAYGINIELRQLVLEKINSVRQQIQQGTYLLENGNYALQAVNMPNLIWDCDEEAAVHLTTTSYNCAATTEPETVFETSMPYTWGDNNSVKNGISSFLDQLFAQNPSLNFLSQSTTYSTQYSEALVLSDQATTIACALMFCFNPTPNFTFACRAKPSAQINDSLYQV